MNNYHTPVLLKEILDLLNVKKGQKVIDATLGGGGHAKSFLEQGAVVLGIDLDEEALTYVRKNLELEIKDSRLFLAQGNFRDIEKIAHLNKFDKVSAILFDLGVSSSQIDTAERGFSFLKEGPLDMRMDKNSALTAEVLVNLLAKGELNDLFNKFGQERRSWVISNSIIRARKIKAIKTTEELVNVLKEAYGIKGELNDFTRNLTSKRVFQALRIAVNDELESIKEALPKALSLLEKGGKIGVISFHSLEDEIVKDNFKNFEKQNMGKMITKKPIEATEEENTENPRAKSAKLRIFEKN